MGLEPTTTWTTTRGSTIELHSPQSSQRVACQEGLEPPTRGLEGRRSIQLSYWQSGRKRSGTAVGSAETEPTRAGGAFRTLYCTSSGPDSFPRRLIGALGAGPGTAPAPRASLVGAPRFELGTSCSQSRCATRLRYAPNGWPSPPSPQARKRGRVYRKGSDRSTALAAIRTTCPVGEPGRGSDGAISRRCHTGSPRPRHGARRRDGRRRPRVGRPRARPRKPRDRPPRDGIRG